MAATIIENQGTEPFTLPAPFRGIIPPGQRIYLNMALADVATALGGSSTYRPADGASLKVALLYDSAYAGAYNTFNQGDAGGGNSVAIASGRIPYGAVSGLSLTSEASLAYNDMTNALSVPNAFLTSGLLVGPGAVAAVRQAAIPNPAGVTIDEDAEARTAINDILAVLRLFGLISV